MSRRKKVIYSILIFFSLAVGSLIFAAYFYMPKEYVFQSKFLQSIHTQYVELENYNAHYFRTGTGEPVILIHGGGSWLYSYQKNIDALSEHFEVFVLDMPGHGYTTALHEPIYDLETFSDFIYKFMDAMQIERTSFVGHSWGGGWAAYFAMKFPDRVDNLILIAPSGLDMPDKSEWRYFNYPVLGEIISNFISLNATKNSLQSMVYDSSFVTELYAREMFSPLSKRNNRRAQLLSQRNIDWTITDKRMGELSHPVLLIFGDTDPYFDTEYANQFAQRLEDATLVFINDTGHLPHEENYKKVNEIIIEFLHLR